MKTSEKRYVPANTLICVVTTFWGIPHNVVAMVFTAADSKKQQMGCSFFQYFSVPKYIIEFL